MAARLACVVTRANERPVPAPVETLVHASRRVSATASDAPSDARGTLYAMAETTAIEWADATWNPWMGCTKVSAGCARCYMFREQRQYGHDPELIRRSKTKFAEPLRWTNPRLVFTCSWSDWFHEAADPWREEAWEVVRRTPQHVYLVLTKRPERAAKRLPTDWGDGYANVWLGVSIENSAFTQRAQLLRKIPAQTRFVSAEPLLGSLYDTRRGRRAALELDGIDWIIAGGESGPRARPMQLEWAREIRDAALESGTAFFLKQLGGWPDKRGDDKALLDGKLWQQMPREYTAPGRAATIRDRARPRRSKRALAAPRA
jgi:protein gp37